MEKQTNGHRQTDTNKSDKYIIDRQTDFQTDRWTRRQTKIETVMLPKTVGASF